MDLNEFLNKTEKERVFALDISKIYIELINITNLNNVYLQSILKRQIEIKELLKGKIGQELDESALKELNDLTTNILDVAHTNFLKTVEGLVGE